MNYSVLTVDLVEEGKVKGYFLFLELVVTEQNFRQNARINEGKKEVNDCDDNVNSDCKSQKCRRSSSDSDGEVYYHAGLNEKKDDKIFEGLRNKGSEVRIAGVKASEGDFI